MKRKWSLRLGAAVLCAVLLGSCGSTAAAPAESTAPADPLTGQQLLYPEQRAAAVVIENTTDSTTQWGIGSASVVLEAMTESGSSTELCLVYPALSAMPVVGPVTRGQDLYWRLLSGQQVLPIQCGSSAYAKRYLEYYNLRAVDAQEVGRNAFVSTGYSWDNTPLWRTSGKAVASVLDSLSISAAVNQSASGSESETAGVLPTLLPQRDTGHLPDANAADAVKATVNFQSGDALHTIACMAQAIARNAPLTELTEEERGVMAHFKNPAMPSVAVTADAAIKIATARQEFASTDTFLEMIGFDQADIRRIRAQEQRARGQALLMEMDNADNGTDVE